jgi:hypothetical protein
MSISRLMQMAAAGAGGEYQISRSLRFNSADDSLLIRTIGTTGDRRKFTFSCWTKISYIGSDIKALMTSSDNASSTSWIYLNTTGGRGTASALSFEIQTPSLTTITTSAVFRDPSAWYHIVVAVDTDQATDTNRVKFYSNGVQLTNTTGTFPAVNRDSVFNTSGFRHGIGAYFDGTTGPYDGLMAEVYWIDGQQLTPSDFGETDETTGVWKPKEYTGTYGTNGFYLNFSDNSDVTATTLGADYSGNGNNYTPSGSPGFSVTAGAGNDSLVDTPTQYGTDTGAGGEVRGNYATLNPIASGAVGTMSNGNLDWVNTNNVQGCIATMAIPSTGKWYAECTVNYFAGGYEIYIGVNTTTAFVNASSRGGEATAWCYSGNGNKVLDSTATAYGSSYAVNDVIGIAVDRDAGTLTFYKNGVSQGAISSFPATKELFWLGGGGGPVADTHGGSWNFGQRPFEDTAPSGFKALVTTNLPEPTVVQGDDYFNTVLYTGTGASLGVTGVGFQPDWVWIKERNGVADFGVYDAVRGVTKQLESNTTTAETTEATGLTAFGADGFTVGALAQLNTSADTYVAWNWKANGAGVSNTDGTISSTVSVSTTSGFSIVTYTGNGVAGATVGHGLGAVPRMIIVKNRDQADAWQVYQAANTANPETDYLVLNTTAATADALDRWNDTAPTSSVFSLGDGVEVNTNTEDYVAYCFADVEGFSKFGGYTGNGSADGTFVYTGFKPEFFLLKNSTSAGNSWHILDTVRGTFNVYGPSLANHTNAAEVTYTIGDVLSNGFKLRDTNQAWNGSGDVYIYMAFAENPFKYSLAR